MQAKAVRFILPLILYYMYFFDPVVLGAAKSGYTNQGGVALQKQTSRAPSLREAFQAVKNLTRGDSLKNIANSCKNGLDGSLKTAAKVSNGIKGSWKLVQGVGNKTFKYLTGVGSPNGKQGSNLPAGDKDVILASGSDTELPVYSPIDIHLPASTCNAIVLPKLSPPRHEQVGLPKCKCTATPRSSPNASPSRLPDTRNRSSLTRTPRSPTDLSPGRPSGQSPPKSRSPRDPSPRGRSPKDRSPKDRLPTDRSPKDRLPKDRLPKDNSPKDSSPTDRSPKGRLPKDYSPKDSSPIDRSPKDRLPTDRSPKDRLPKYYSRNERSSEGRSPRHSPTDRSPTNRSPKDYSPSKRSSRDRSPRHSPVRTSTPSPPDVSGGGSPGASGGISPNVPRGGSPKVSGGGSPRASGGISPKVPRGGSPKVSGGGRPKVSGRGSPKPYPEGSRDALTLQAATQLLAGVPSSRRPKTPVNDVSAAPPRSPAHSPPKVEPQTKPKASPKSPQRRPLTPPPNDLPSLRGPHGHRRPGLQRIFHQISMGRFPSQCENPRDHAPQVVPPLKPAAAQQPPDPVQRQSRTRITPMPGPEPPVQIEDPHQFFNRMSERLMSYFTDKIEPPSQKEFDDILDNYALARARIERRETVEESADFLLMHYLPEISEAGYESVLESPKLKQRCMKDCNEAYGYILIPPDGFVSDDLLTPDDQLAELFTCGSLVPITDGMGDPNFYAYIDQDGGAHYRCWCATHVEMCVTLEMYDVDPDGWNEARTRGGRRARKFLREVFRGTGVKVLNYETVKEMTNRFYDGEWWETFRKTERDINKKHELIPANDEYWKNEAEFWREPNKEESNGEEPE